MNRCFVGSICSVSNEKDVSRSTNGSMGDSGTDTYTAYSETDGLSDGTYGTGVTRVRKLSGPR